MTTKLFNTLYMITREILICQWKVVVPQPWKSIEEKIMFLIATCVRVTLSNDQVFESLIFTKFSISNFFLFFQRINKEHNER